MLQSNIFWEFEGLNEGQLIKRVLKKKIIKFMYINSVTNQYL